MPETKEAPGRIVPVGFANQGLEPPSDLYVSSSDAIVLTSYNSAAGIRLDVRGILLRTDGIAVPFQFFQTPNTDRSAKSTVFPLTEGFLLSAAVFLGSGSSKRGQCYVQLFVSRGIETSQVLHRIITQGYVGTAISLSWPGNRLEQPGEGAGYFRAIVGTDPAAGALINETVPTGARWRVNSVRITLTTSGAVGNRRPNWSSNDGANTFATVPHPLTQPATTTQNYNWAIGMALGVTVRGGDDMAGLPANLILPGGYHWLVDSVAFDPGDNYAAPVYEVEEWIDP